MEAVATLYKAQGGVNLVNKVNEHYMATLCSGVLKRLYNGHFSQKNI